MSSANSLAVAEGARRSVTSFTKILNKRGPRTLPCGTPLTTRQDFEIDVLILTDCDLLVRNAAIQWNKLPLIP